ncbi:MAG: aminotransferase class V-fold PLP-dependent enzyme, partial [Patescibacteria group bacterium]
MNIFNNIIYMDYASLNPIDKGVLRIIKKYSSKDYGNPSSIYKSGVRARDAVSDAKARIANTIHAHEDEIIFTSGGTEANQLALNSIKGKKIIISNIEHSSIINEDNAIHIPVNNKGIVDTEVLSKSLTEDIALVSVMAVNNEIGSIEPIHEIAKIIRDANKRMNTKILFHTDACQAFLHLPIYVEKLAVDMISLDGNKIYGPRGVGMLYIKRGSENNSEKIIRAGTENIPVIIRNSDDRQSLEL